MKTNGQTITHLKYVQSAILVIGQVMTDLIIMCLFAAWITTVALQMVGKHVASGIMVPTKAVRRRICPISRLAHIPCTVLVLWLLVAESGQAGLPVDSASPNTNAISLCSNGSVWEGAVGQGFKAGAQSISTSFGAGYGLRILGSKESHDLGLFSISYGRMIGSTEGADHWYRGNWEFRGELFSGAQFSPTVESLVGLTPHLRYNFATGSRWVPFLDAGAGVSATSIGAPDLSGTFEFNLQGAIGVRWFIKNDLALGIDAHYLHMSCAGIDSPNRGLNNAGGALSLSWFF